MSLFQILAQTLPAASDTGAKPPVPTGLETLRGFLPIILIVVIFYVLMFGSKRKQEKQRQSMLSQLKRGDEVVTIGGEVGKVIEARPDRVQLKLDENTNTKVWYLRSAIHRVLEEEKAENK